MIYKKIGADRISAVGFGTGIHDQTNKDYSMLEQSLCAAIESGVNFVDTAPVYGDGSSEEALGRVLRGVGRDKIFLASKVSPADTTYAGVIRSVEDSLARLQIDTLDLCQIHWPSTTVPVEETTQALENLVLEGKVRHIGVSNFQLHEVQNTVGALQTSPLRTIQSEYNFFERSVEKNVLPFCKNNDIMLIAYSPLAQGRMVNGKKQRNILNNMAKKYNATQAQIVIRWLIEDSSVLVIPNTSKPNRAMENASAADICISPEDMKYLSKNLTTSMEMVDTKNIRPSNDYNRKVYQTIEEALENDMKMSPSPLELSEEIKLGNFLKPIRLKELADTTKGKKYDLVEGRLRYWAWIIAYGWDKPIPSLIWKN